MLFKDYISSTLSYFIGTSSTPVKMADDAKSSPAPKAADIEPKKAPNATPKREYTLEELRNGNTKSLRLVSIFGKVYNLSMFHHPGGDQAISDLAGDIADDIFENGKHRNLKDKIATRLAKYEVGTLKK